jgi:hypothetical protein
MNDNYDLPSESNLDPKDAGDWTSSLLDLYLDWEDFTLNTSGMQNPEPFVGRCLGSAAVALTLRRYGACAEMIGFVPVSFGRYVDRLESTSELGADPVLRHFGITERSAVDAASLLGFAKMWRALRITLREAVITLRITLMLPDSVMAGVRFRRIGPVDSLASCENLLTEAAHNLTPAQRAAVSDMEKRLIEAYEGSERETLK